MSIDILQDKIRKLKNPSMVDFTVRQQEIPGYLLEEEGSFIKAYVRFCTELMEGLKGLIPAVRFPFSMFAVHGEEGLSGLRKLLTAAREIGFYVLLDSPQILTPWNAEAAAQLLVESAFPADAMLIVPYIGSDSIRPFVDVCKNSGKALFCIVRSPNKSAAELQDLMTGSRLVQGAAAELVNRFGEQTSGKYGYTQIAAAASAGSPDSLRTLRSKFNRTFILVDGLDYPSGNAKNCSYAFDQFGHGAVVCAGPSITAAWQSAGADPREYVSHAVQAAERMKKNLNRYLNVL